MLRKKFLSWPTALQAILKCRARNASTTHPFADRQGLAEGSYLQHAFEWLCRPAIVLLLLIGRPAAIFRRIAFIIVDAIQRRFARPLAHVFNENGYVSPPLADRDASRTIILVSGIPRIGASPMHVSPNGIKRMTAESMTGCASRKQLARETSARSRLARKQVVGRNDFFDAADTTASMKHPASSLIPLTADNGPSVEDMAGSYRFQSCTAARSGMSDPQRLSANKSRRTSTSALAKPLRITLFRWLTSNDGELAENSSSQIGERHGVTIAQNECDVMPG